MSDPRMIDLCSQPVDDGLLSALAWHLNDLIAKQEADCGDLLSPPLSSGDCEGMTVGQAAVALMMHPDRLIDLLDETANVLYCTEADSPGGWRTPESRSMIDGVYLR